MDETITTNGINLLDQVVALITQHPAIWIPVLAAWAIGFLYAKRLQYKDDIDDGYTMRQSEKEWRVYKMNGGVAFLLYGGLNFTSDIPDVLGASLLAASVAVLAPALWFRVKK